MSEDEIKRAIERYGYRPSEADRCDCCRVKAKTRLGPSPQMNAVTDLSIKDGWALLFFPWSDDRRNYAAERERTWLCESCGRKVAEYIAHMAKPWTGDEDIL